MIKSLSVSNFKPFNGPLGLDLYPVTVLAGLNSSGKSSIIQTLLLLTQTLANTNADKALILNGNIIQLGTFSDIKNERSAAHTIELGVCLTSDGAGQHAPGEGWRRLRRVPYNAIEDAITEVSTTAVFAAQSLSSSSAIEASRVILRSAKVTATINTSPIDPIDDIEEIQDSDSTETTPSPITITGSITRLTTDDQARFLNGVRSEYLRLIPHGDTESYAVDITTGDQARKPRRYITRLNHFLPGSFIGTFSPSSRQLRELGYVLDLLLGGRSMYEFSGPPRESLYKKISEHSLSKSLLDRVRELVASRPTVTAFDGRTTQELLAWARRVPLKTKAKSSFTSKLKEALVVDLMQGIYGVGPDDKSLGLETKTDDFDTAAIDQATRRLVAFFGSMVRYIGPLRADPQGAQRFSPSNEPDDVGMKGEFAAAVYEANRELEITWWNPISDSLSTGTLGAGLDFWVKYLSVANSVSTREAGPSGVSWFVEQVSGAQQRSLSAVGVGVSQVLPILVAGLLAPKGAVVMIEQPELHLHPRAQARIGDFFVSLSRLNKQCIIETHSDCLVNQLRLSISRRRKPQAASGIGIYFASSDARGDSHFTPVKISETGAITNWPDGFFDETALQEESLARESIRQQAERRSRNG